MQANPDDKLASAVFALGLSLGVVERDDVVRWADRGIEETDEPPLWMIDLALSRSQDLMDLIGDLNEVGKGADPVTVCEAAFGLLPDMRDFSFDEAESLAKRIYHIALQCIGDWQNEVLRKADWIDDTFAFAKDGILTPQEPIADLTRFIKDHRNKSVLHLLYPSDHFPVTAVIDWKP